ncbi:hypothetical protein [Pseudomonas azerbaijanoccidentalis]
MSASNNQEQYVTLTFSLPQDYYPPSDGEGETRISVYTIHTTSPVNLAEQSYSLLRNGRWNYSFPHNYSDVSVKYLVKVSMTHNGIPLLIDLDYFVIVHRAPHRQIINLSPIGRLYIQAQEAEIVESEHALTIAAHEHGGAYAQLTQVTISEQMATAFYLDYDPDTVTPGKRYTLTGTENKYRNSIQVYPDSVVLNPIPVALNQ